MELNHLLILSLVIISISSFSVDPTGKFILDNYGRYGVFHGVNVVNKEPPYIPTTDAFDVKHSVSAEDIKYMKHLGFNLVRLGVEWEAVEKKEGEYDDEYLKNVTKLINSLGENGIYTLVDTHQDLFSKKFCGNGVPYFYVDKLGYKTKCDSSAIAYILGLVKVCKPMSSYNFRYDERGVPLKEDCAKNNWVEYHFTPEVTSAYKNFYDNKEGVQDKYIDFWKHLAITFKGNPYIIGYDIWNEPFPGGLWDDLTMIIPSRADMKQLLPVYEKIDAAIRAIDPDFLLFFENMPFPDFLPLFGGLILGGLRKTPGAYNQVYNVHSYCCNSGADACPSSGEPTLEISRKRCPGYHKKKINTNLKDAEKLKTPLIISEFGNCLDGEACYNELSGVVRNSETNFVSWAYWIYKHLDDPYQNNTVNNSTANYGLYYNEGGIQVTKERTLSRGYVQYYQGKPISFEFTNDETDFQTVVEYDSLISAPTTLYFNKEFFYKNGYDIKVVNNKTQEEIKCTIELEGDNYILIKDIDSSLDGKEVKIIFTAK